MPQRKPSPPNRPAPAVPAAPAAAVPLLVLSPEAMKFASPWRVHEDGGDGQASSSDEDEDGAGLLLPVQSERCEQIRSYVRASKARRLNDLGSTKMWEIRQKHEAAEQRAKARAERERGSTSWYDMARHAAVELTAIGRTVMNEDESDGSESDSFYNDDF